ncbi:MND1-interacting protein 1 [Phoenix dactylifera]|uniref:MND1-interacting protein 1 n=1 Tax=Phoenix dactylifera TaxID=42345 RepID=A0A8B7CI44_PHODC|nr:MND1-interacting protein 1 [Phoenix dactylifera]
MGSNAKDRSARSGRKACHAGKHQPSSSRSPPPASSSSSYPSPSPALAEGDPHIGHPISNPNAHPSGAYDDNGWGYCTEEQLEELLLKNLDLIYREALNRLLTLGYDEAAALRAVLCSGHCYGSMDVLSNILHNAMSHINWAPAAAGHCDAGGGVPANGFTDLCHLQEYSLAEMMRLLQQVRPRLTRGDAMWCLLMSDLHVGRASTIDIPTPPYPAPTAVPAPLTAGGCSSACGAEYARPTTGLCKFHAAEGGGGSTDLPPSVWSAMRRNANASVRQRAEVGLGSSSSEQPQVDRSAAAVEAGDDARGDLVDSVLKGLEAMSLDEEGKSPDGAEDHKKEVILDLVRQIRELEGQVKERKEWAQKTGLQAARKLSNDLIELRTLRMEREENQRLKKGKQVLEDATLKRLTEMENALKKATGQVDLANAAVCSLETENAEIQAEVEASELSASESARMCLDVARKEKKLLKKVQAWEKQREKIQQEIDKEKRKIAETEQKLAEVKVATKETEAKWKREVKLRELGTAQAEEARRAREAAEINAKRRQEALQRKIELDFQCHKDDIQRLEEELSRLHATAASTQLNNLSFNALNSGDADAMKALKEGNEEMHTGFNKPQESSRKLNHDRVCVICLKDDVSVLFLPCAHQVVCVNCNKDHEKSKGSCPCCNTKIDERIRVYGVSS